MFKNNIFLRKIFVLLFYLGFAVVFFSCSQKEATPVLSSQNPEIQVRTVWAKDFAEGQLEAHYLKHRGEFGTITQQEYLNAAKILLNSAPSQDILEKRRDNGDILHYRVSTGEFAVMAGDGRIRTYFKADYRYWLKQ